METTRVAHIFARVYWFKTHPRENWFHPRVLVLSPDQDCAGPATFISVSRIYGCCAIVHKTVKFDFGEDNVVLVILCGSTHSM